ncbi:hypothetical protein, partial [Mycobacterium tuberculosis]|uniref:hypothetical protein n=1 Tax=Mycobacterium tuberculosis TaxID=1773 RepID=UPI000A9B7640
TSRSPDRPQSGPDEPGPRKRPRPHTLVPVVLFFEIMLVLATVVISWFALYTLYRLVTDES